MRVLRSFLPVPAANLKLPQREVTRCRDERRGHASWPASPERESGSPRVLGTRLPLHPRARQAELQHMAHHYYSPLQDADRYRAPYTIPLNDAPAMSAASTASQSHHRNSSHSRPRPTTPLRPPSRTSLRASQTTPSGPSASHSGHDFPLADLEPAFAELSDGMADLEANFMHLQLLNESISRFNEDFAGFLYGLNMSAFCIDFPEVRLHLLDFSDTGFC